MASKWFSKSLCSDKLIMQACDMFMSAHETRDASEVSRGAPASGQEHERKAKEKVTASQRTDNRQHSLNHSPSVKFLVLES